MTVTSLLGATFVTPLGQHTDGALVIADRRIQAIARTPPEGSEIVSLEGGFLVPGFIDIQVNGGGGVLFNDAPCVEAIAELAAAHRRHGTTGLLPTLISDDAHTIARAIEAVEAAIEADVPGILGIHLEGPFINPDRRGIHAARFVRALTECDLDLLTRPSKGVRLLTLAPECVPEGMIRRLREGGLIVAAGHSTADYATVRRALDEGLDGFTHLFNAMTQIGSREPGMLGAALEDRSSRFGLIVDGHHVHPASLRIALAARGLDAAMLVTDAMPPAGTDMTQFDLQGRTIMVENGVLRGDDGTLAGSALTMDLAVRNCLTMLDLSLPDACRLASTNPAAFLRMLDIRGAIAPGLAADLVHLDEDLQVRRVWIGGRLFDYTTGR